MSAETQSLNTSTPFRNVISKQLTAAQTVWHYFELTRLHKFPLGNILVIWPSLWAVTMAAFKTTLPPYKLLVFSVLFTLGGTLVHSTACVINDICDVDFDRQVERTRTRPLASGALPLSGAWILLIVMTIACLACLNFANGVAAFVGIFGIFPFHGLYPLMKRWTWWPQAWLGIAMNWGFPVAWLSVNPTYTSVDLKVIAVMLFGTLCWTIVYDTEYACQDRSDDAKAGVKSTALLFGDNVRGVLMAFATIFVLCLAIAGALNGQTAVYYFVTCGGTATHFIWQFSTWRIHDPKDCGAKFKSNGDMGYLVWAGILLDYMLKQ